LDAGTSPKPEAPDEQLLRSEGQHKLLSDALREIAAQRRAIDQRLAASVGDRQPADNEIAAFNQQRRVLEAQHRQFEAQASQLARKIGVLKGRREGTHAPAPGTPGAR
jgi:septal ring factor EnvC (AmiA/AmiB activator)